MIDRHLPAGWITASIEEALISIRGISFPKEAKRASAANGLIACLRTANIQQNIEWEDLWFVDNKYLKREEQVVQQGDILISISNSLDLLGKVAQVINIPHRSTLGTFIANLRVPDPLNCRFIYYYLSSFGFKEKVREKASTTTNISNISVGKLEKINIKIPPLAEQHRIVDKIEELFSDLDDGIASLKKAQQQLKVYRQAVLKWAFEGKLTAQWREEQKRQGKLESAETLLEQIKAEREQRYQEKLAQWQADVKAWEANGKVGKKPGKPSKPIKNVLTKDDIEELPELPQGWQWVFPEDICAPENYSLAIGPFGSNLKVSDYTNSGIPLVFVRHITGRNFDLNPKYISQEKFIELLPHAVKSLDLLITKMGDPPGDCEIYPEGRSEAVITADCLKFSVWTDYANLKFYKYCINSTLIKKQLGLITQGVAQKKISLERFKRIKFPFPNFAEQNKIVEEIESRLSICDSLETTITENLQRAEALRQSILKQAFEGKLVPQDPNDEPASVLLERIRQTRNQHKQLNLNNL